ncbi:hypothetical protein [Paenibacillus chitinolyticus]|uniref:hypothetical protein n=1 Tax=Paenibacillus chitinolyticus TaxID=79263 RepID=UPI001C48C1B0|nr:hypothetical protein [Paenibacillus chitinolyticus]MBV6717180.1 hypothetical protein [Paenibacillus chitinolyticus]
MKPVQPNSASAGLMQSALLNFESTLATNSVGLENWEKFFTPSTSINVQFHEPPKKSCKGKRFVSRKLTDTGTVWGVFDKALDQFHPGYESRSRKNILFCADALNKFYGDR